MIQDANDASEESKKQQIVDFQKGIFAAKYTDSTHQNGERHLTSTGTLVFSKPIAGVINISGAGSDQDGPFEIIDGKASVGTGKACWIEKSSSELILSLVWGRFHRDNKTQSLSFEGHFKCSNRAKGRFIALQAKPKDD